MTNHKYVIGVDEAGRGPLAGPIAVAAVLLPRRFRLNRRRQMKKLRDSKKLTLIQRRLWFKYIQEHSQISYAVSMVSPHVIDRINVTRAADLAAKRVVKRLIKKHNLKEKHCKILLDGSLNLRTPLLEYKEIIRGDEKIRTIQLASVVAKVRRDDLMIRLHRVYDKYDFARHKGYGTSRHKYLLKKHGPCEIHRLTFLKS